MSPRRKFIKQFGMSGFEEWAFGRDLFLEAVRGNREIDVPGFRFPGAKPAGK